MDTLPTLAEVAEEVACAADLAEKWRQLRPVPPAWDPVIGLDDEVDGCYKRMTDAIALADAVYDTLLIALAGGGPDSADCERIAAVLRAHDPAMEGLDLLADSTRLMRAAYEITRERVNDGHGCAGLLKVEQDATDRILAALALPVHKAEDLVAVSDVIAAARLHSGQAQAAVARYIAAQPLLHIDPRSVSDREERLQTRAAQELFQRLSLRFHEESAEGVD